MKAVVAANNIGAEDGFPDGTGFNMVNFVNTICVNTICARPEVLNKTGLDFGNGVFSLSPSLAKIVMSTIRVMVDGTHPPLIPLQNDTIHSSMSHANTCLDFSEAKCCSTPPIPTKGSKYGASLFPSVSISCFIMAS